MIKTNLKQTGFTIVELLVVIVIIGILAAITVVSYVGISQRAAVATIQSDLKSAATQLGIDNVNDGSYPLLEENANSGLGLAKSPGTTYSYTKNASGYCLSATSTSAGTTYHISTGGAIESGGCFLTPAQIASGDYHACIATSDGKAYCWGPNFDGELGDGTNTQSLVPVAVSTSGVLSGKTVLSVTSGSGRSCAIASDNLAYCWGRNPNGQLGNNSTTSSNIPVAVSTAVALSGKTVLSVSAGNNHTCAIASDNLAYCWGANNYGQLGNNSTTQSLVPVAVSTAGVLSGKTVKAISASNNFTCAIASDDLAYCWGRDNYGQLGNNSTTQSLVPVAVSTAGVLSGKTVKSIASGASQTCAIASDDLAYCWGSNSYGELGNNSTTQSLVPVAVSTAGVLSGKTVKSISIGSIGSFACVIASDDLVYCWGFNNQGELGNNSTTQSLVPVAVSTAGVLSGKTVESISGGTFFSCAIGSDDASYCWGANNFGQLGNNSTTQSLVPVAVGTISL